MKFRHGFFKPGLGLCLILFAALGANAQSSWITGYPQLLSGATSVDILVKTDSSGTVYFAIYKTIQSGMTSAQLKNDALFGSGSPNLVRRGSAAVTSNTLQTIEQSTLTQNTTYHIYVVAESSTGVLMPNNKVSYTARFFPKRQQDFYNFTNTSVNSYLMYFPEDYYKTTTTFPLLVFLGGTGEMTHGGAANPNLLLQTGLPEVINLGKEIPLVVASPQGINTWGGSAMALDAYINFLKVNYRVNSSQIFITGLSDGGMGVFQYADVFPTKVRGIVPISTWPTSNVNHFLNTPVWAFMGNSDTNAQLIAWINSLIAIGGNAKYNGYPGAHEKLVWNAVYDGSRGDDIYQWMFNILGQNSPPGNIPPAVNAGADQSLNLPLSQAQLTGTASDADGTISTFTWTQISGPSVTLTNESTAILTLTNILPGTYVFQLTVTDNVGASANDQVTVVVSAGGAVTREFDVNLTWAWNLQGGTIWNDFVTTGGGVVGNSMVLYDKNHVISPVSISITAPFQDGTNNHGVSPGVYPTNVMKYFLRSTQTKKGTLKLSGLSGSSVYDLSILSSNVDSWYPSDTRLTVSGQPPITIDARGNANTLVNFLSVAPNASGEITIAVAPATTGSTTIGVINALVLKERPVPNNTPPVVNAGLDQQIALPFNQLALTGTATDPDGSIATWLWTKISGPVITMTNTTTPVLTLTNIAAGTYVFQFTAGDNGGASASDQVTVTVDPGTIVPPVVIAGPDQQVMLPLAQLQLAGTATDSDGFIYSWSWTKVSGPAVTMTNTTTSTLTLTGLSIGTYVFQLGVQDNSGGTASDQVTIVVNGNLPPLVNAGPDQQFTLPLNQILLAGTASDPDGTIASLLWTKISGPTVTMTNATTSTLTLTNILAGTYVFQLAAVDNGGAPANDQITIIVNPAPVTGIREFDINVTWAWNKQGGLPWNDFITTNGGIVGNSAVLFDKNGVSSTISIAVTAPFQDGANNHGVIPGMYPNNVMQYYLRSTTTKIGSLKLAGLSPSKQYDLSILSSNIDVWYPSDTRLTVQGQSATVNARSNANLLVNFVNVVPTAIGEIPITVAPATTNSANVGVINAIILTEHDAGAGGRTMTPDLAAADREKPSTVVDYVNVFPNPVEDHINVEISSSLPTPEIYSIEFIDVRGTRVFSQRVEANGGADFVSERISTDFMQSGLYIMAVHSRQNGVKYFKVLKK